MPTRGLINPELLTGIADAIRAKNGTNAGMTPAQMAAAVGGLVVTPDGIVTATGQMTTEQAAQTRENLKLNAYVTPEMFGAVGDGVTDDTTALKDAIATGEIVVGVNEYLCTEPLSLGNSTYIFGSIINNTSNGIIIENKSGGEYHVNVMASSQTADQFTGVQIKNCNQTKFEIKTQNFYIGTEVIGDETGCAYNIINRVHSINSKYFMYLKAKGNGWCNSNYFYNMRFIGYSNTLYKGADYGITIELLSGSNGPNGNNFINVCAEGSYCAINIDNGRDNTFENIRTEGCTYTAKFGSNATRNLIRVSYGQITNVDGNTANTVMSYSQISNAVLSNLIATTGSLSKRTASNATYGTGDNLYKVYTNGTGYNLLRSISNMQAVENGLKATGEACVGFLINVENNKSIRIIKSVDGNHRLGCVPFDENWNFIEGASIKVSTSTLYQTNSSYLGKYYMTGSNSPATETSAEMFFDASVKYAFVFVRVAGDVTTRSVSLYGAPDNYEMASNPKATLAAIPTSTGYYMGQEVYSTASAKKWVWNGSSWVEVNLT